MNIKGSGKKHHSLLEGRGKKRHCLLEGSLKNVDFTNRICIHDRYRPFHRGIRVNSFSFLLCDLFTINIPVGSLTAAITPASAKAPWRALSISNFVNMVGYWAI